MSAQAPSSSSSGAASKVAVLNSGELFPISQVAGASTIPRAPGADAASSSGADAQGQRRKVATSFERSFAVPEPVPSTSQGTASRPVLKAGKAVSSAPPAAPQRPLTELEKAFASRPIQDQRWLLSFPLAMKQFYFSFAESTNHDQILTGLINRFPELLDSSGASPPALQVAIERGNWTPAMRFVTAIAFSPHIKLLRHQCGLDRRTYSMLALERLGRTSPDNDKDAELSMARPVLRAMLKACPDLLTTADARGRNTLHYCSLHCSSNEVTLTALLQDLRDLSSDSSSTFSGRLGNALVARDSDGCQAGDLAVSPAAKEGFQRLQRDFPPVEEDQQMVESPVSAIDSFCAALAGRDGGRKSTEFVNRLVSSVGQRNPQLMLLATVDDPVRTAVTWLQKDSKAELKQALTDIGMADLTCLVDSL